MSKGTINKVILLGRLGSNPEVRYMPSGMMVVNASLATNDGYKDRKSNEYIDHTEWHRIIMFGKTAELVSNYAKKGSLIYIEGRIKTNKWKDKNNNERYTTEIIVTQVQLIGQRIEKNQNSFDNNEELSSTAANIKKPSDKLDVVNKTSEDDINQIHDFDDEIPF